MSVSRDDFSIAFRSALLQRGGAQKFSVLSLIFLALIIFFLDVYGAQFTKPVRSFLNDVVYRVTFLASTPTRFLPQAGKDISNFFNVKEENERLKLELEKYKSLINIYKNIFICNSIFQILEKLFLYKPKWTFDFATSISKENYFKRINDLKLKNPQIVGFGISNYDTFNAATTYAKGAIIGSAFIKYLKTNGTQNIDKFIETITSK